MKHRIRGIDVLYDIGGIKRFPILLRGRIRKGPGPTARTDQKVFSCIDRDPIKPCVEGALPPELRQRPVGFNKGLLGHILDLGWISNQPGDKPLDTALILGDQQFKRPLIALLNPQNEPRIGLTLIAHAEPALPRT
jgi:hypothetical protein